MSEGAPERLVGDRYRVIRELGRGGMGVVYLGRDLRLEMDVALKFCGVAHADATLWLKREFRAVSALRHPNLVELYELVAHEATCYFSMEYLPGVDPRRWVEATAAIVAPTAAIMAPRATPTVDMARLRFLLGQLAEGIAFLHARGVIHRDVKPSNVLVGDGSVKLLDFGLALGGHRLAEGTARETRIVGTAAYLAPEYLERLTVSPQMDVYALGVLAYELVTGQPPFGGTLHLLSRMRAPLKVPRAASLNTDLPGDLDDLIDSMLAADPSLRPSALAVVTRLGGDRVHGGAHRSLAFVGRKHELSAIAERIEDVTPRARVVLVTGPSGAGKTALIEHAIAAARSDDLLTWRGRCDERERIPYRAFDAIVDDLATELASEPRIAHSVEYAASLARVFPVLAPLLATEVSEAPPVADLRVERERAQIALADMLGASLASSRGVVFIDDLQWADEDSLALLELLVTRIAKPLTIVASWTTDGTPPPTISSCEVIALDGLEETHLATLIAQLAPSATPSRRLEAAQLAAGSPYLAELIGRELSDANIVDPHAAEQRRLARLDPVERSVAEVTAIAGRAATFEQLRALADLPSGRLQSVLRSLEHGRIVRATPTVTGEPVYAFYHQRLRSATHASLVDSQRRALHEKFAMWFEARVTAPEPTLADAGQLAYHWEHAGDVALARMWAERAGDAARAQLAWGVAAEWYERAGVKPALAECLFLAGKLARAAEMFLALGGDAWRVRAAEAYLKLGELERGLEILDDVLERRGRPRTKSRAISILRAAGVTVRWLAPTKMLREQGDDVLAAAYRVIASFLSTPHPIESLEYVVRGVALAEARGDRATHAMGMAMLSAYLTAGTLGRFGDRAVTSAQQLSETCGSPYPAMVASGAAGLLATLRGQWGMMRAHNEKADVVCKKLGLERSWEASFLRAYRALGEMYAGEPARAAALLHSLADTAEDLWTRAMVGSFRGRVMVLAGDLPSARAIAAQLDRTQAAHRGMAAIYRGVFLGELALAEGNWTLAAHHAEAVEKDARGQWLHTMPAAGAMIDVVAATAALGQRRPAQAKAIAHRLYRRGRVTFYAATALRLGAQAARMAGDAPRERALLARASEVAEVRGGKVDRLAIRALRGEIVDFGSLASAMTWSTAGMIET